MEIEKDVTQEGNETGQTNMYLLASFFFAGVDAEVAFSKSRGEGNVVCLQMSFFLPSHLMGNSLALCRRLGSKLFVFRRELFCYPFVLRRPRSRPHLCG